MNPIISKRFLKLVLKEDKGNDKYNVLANIDIDSKTTFNTSASITGAMQEANIIISGLQVSTMSYLSTSISLFLNKSKRFIIEILAGYDDKNGLIYRGVVRQAIPNFNKAEYTIELKCISDVDIFIDSLKNYSFSGNKSLTYILEEINKDLKYVFINELKEERYIDNYSYQLCSIRDHLVNLSQTTGTNIFIDNNKLIVFEEGAGYGKNTIKLDTDNIIGGIRPNGEGCELDIKLDPTIKGGQKATINSVRFPQLNNNVFFITNYSHYGDTRGNEWKTNLKLTKENLYNY